MYMHIPYIRGKYVAYMYILDDIIGSGTDMATACEVDVAVGCVLGHICKTVGLYIISNCMRTV